MNQSSQKEYIISVDQGTTGSRVFCIDTRGAVISQSYREFRQIFPSEAWVEHDAEEIWNGIMILIREALQKGGLSPSDALAIGITNQRETSLFWDKNTGRPYHNAIVWQCRRTAARCEELKNAGYTEMIKEKTGLVTDAYFSATKLEWLLDHVSGLRKKALEGEALAGTMDSYLLFRFTGEHRTDYTNASRTMLFNIHNFDWDDALLKLFGIPRSCLPEAVPSRFAFGKTRGLDFLPDGIPVTGMAGDQQAALFGQLCTQPGMAKNTYGTGAFLLYNTGTRLIQSRNGLLTTVAADKDGKPAYALEGSVFIAGAVVQWLRDFMRFISTSAESEELTESIRDDDDPSLVFVPAFTGLGAPHWDMNARGAILGLTRSTTPAQITKAALKSIALQTYDLVKAMEQDTGSPLHLLRADGGASANSWLMQYQADILNTPVERPDNRETTALGAAYLAGMEAGVWKDADDLRTQTQNFRRFLPSMSEERRKKEIALWEKGVSRSKNWI